MKSLFGKFTDSYKLMPLAVAFALLLLIGTPVHAQEEQAPAQNEQKASQNYDYVAKRSNNLTLLVRRSLQLYDESNGQISLSEAQIVYAETNIVRQLGSYGLNVGQEVNVPADLVAQFATSSQNLSEAQVAAWGRYARVASFDLSHIQPSSAVAKPGDDSKPDGGDQSTDQPAGDQTDKEGAGQADDNNGDTDWWWFAILAAAILGIWYWLRDRDTKPTPKNTTRRKK